MRSRFVDRDALMRFYLGHAVGHAYTHGTQPILPSETTEIIAECEDMDIVNQNGDDNEGSSSGSDEDSDSESKKSDAMDVDEDEDEDESESDEDAAMDLNE